MKTITSNNNIFKNHGSTTVDSQTVENVFSFLESLGFSNINIDFDGDEFTGGINGDFNKKDISHIDIDSLTFGITTYFYNEIFKSYESLTQTSFTIDDLGFQYFNGDIDDSTNTFIELIDEFILTVFDGIE